MAEKLVIIGNGMAPGRMLEHLFELAPDRFDVTIFNAEPRVNYDRIMLSPVLSGEKSFDDIVIHGDAWYIRNGVTLYKGVRITDIDRAARIVTSDTGIVASYDKLVIATGSVPFIPPIQGNQLAGVLSYRDLDDVNAMMIAARSRGRAVVIGGGLLGLEAAAGLAQQGMDVTVLHNSPTLMNRQLDAAAGQMLEDTLTGRGIRVICKADTTEILGDSRVTGIRLADGAEIAADMVVMAVGIRPNAVLGRGAGLAVNRGIVVDAQMRTTDPQIYALGECAEVAGACFGLVAPLYDMASVLAAQLAGEATTGFVEQATATRLKVTGVNLYSAGDFRGDPECEEIVLQDQTAGIYKRLVLRDDRIVGIVLYGEAADGPWFFDLLRRNVEINSMRDTLIFGQAYQGGTPLDPMVAAAVLPGRGMVSSGHIGTGFSKEFRGAA